MPRRHRGRSPLSWDPLYDPRTADAAVRFLESLSARRVRIWLPTRESSLDSNVAPVPARTEGHSTSTDRGGLQWMHAEA